VSIHATRFWICCTKVWLMEDIQLGDGRGE
jgi:hypothetical protein